MGQVDLEARARRTHQFHVKGLDSYRLRHLTAEKYMLHVDGEGDAQWYDIVDGQRLSMMPVLNGFSPSQDNQLRPILDNFVAHLTTQPYRFVVDFKPDRESRAAAIIDQAIINNEVATQKWNYLMAEAKMLAAVAGFCPVHQMWREDEDDSFEAVMPGQMPGHIDAFVGNPFDFVFNAGAKRASSHRRTWGRTLPADLVRALFGRPDLEGSDKIPSASAFQRAVRKWTRLGRARHGHSEITASSGHEEMIALVYDEILPGIDPQYPQGSLCIIALQGAAVTRPEEARGAPGRPVHLWSGPLPAGTFSSTIHYSHHRFDDVLGKPYIGDIDDDQIELNQRLSILKEYVRRASRPQLGGSGAVNEDTVGFEGDTYFELEAMVGAGQVDLQWLEFPGSHIATVFAEAQDIRDRMYRKAGWTAPSRGEVSGQSGKAIIALQQADDSLMGPIGQRTKEELEDMAQLAWRLRKNFMDVPSVLEAVGEELAHMVQPYVDKTMMSRTPPRFRLVSGFGTSMEAKAQQLMNMLPMIDPLGEPVLTTRQFKKAFPDQSLYNEVDDPADVRERRPRVVNELIRQAAKRYTQQLQGQFVDPMTGEPKWQPRMGDPMTQQLGQIVEMEVAQSEDVLMDDDMATNIDVLSIITQDTTEDPVARYAAQQRQMRYFMWLQGQQMATSQQQTQQVGAEAQAKEQGKMSGQAGPQARPAGTQGAQHNSRAPEGGSASASSMVSADKQFEQRIA